MQELQTALTQKQRRLNELNADLSRAATKQSEHQDGLLNVSNLLRQAKINYTIDPTEAVDKEIRALTAERLAGIDASIQIMCSGTDFEKRYYLQRYLSATLARIKKPATLRALPVPKMKYIYLRLARHISK